VPTEQIVDRYSPALRPGQARRAGVGSAHRAEPQLSANRTRPGRTARAHRQPRPPRQRRFWGRGSKTLTRADRQATRRHAQKTHRCRDLQAAGRGFRVYLPSAHVPDLFQAMREGDPYRVQALSIFGKNPLTVVARADDGLRNLLSCPWIVGGQRTFHDPHRSAGRLRTARSFLAKKQTNTGQNTGAAPGGPASDIRLAQGPAGKRLSSKGRYHHRYGPPPPGPARLRTKLLGHHGAN
jgi:hypothetical protein